MSFLSGIRTWKRCQLACLSYCLQDIANYYLFKKLCRACATPPNCLVTGLFQTNPASCICRKLVGVLILFLLPHWLEVFFWGRQRLFFARLAANFLLERNTTAWYLILLEFQDPWLAFPTPLSSSNLGMINPGHDHCRMIVFFFKYFKKHLTSESQVISPWPDCQSTFLLGEILSQEWSCAMMPIRIRIHRLQKQAPNLAGWPWWGIFVACYLGEKARKVEKSREKFEVTNGGIDRCFLPAGGLPLIRKPRRMWSP